MQTGPLVGMTVALLLLVLPSSFLLGPGLAAGCDLAASRRLVALCSRARKRSAGMGLPVSSRSALPVGVEEDEAEDEGARMFLRHNSPDYAQADSDISDDDVDATSLFGSLPDSDSGSKFWSHFASRHHHRSRRSTLMQHLVQTCCTQGCSFDKLKEICFGK